MPSMDKSSLCQLLASLFSPPDGEMVNLVCRGTVYSFFKNLGQAWGADEGALEGFQIDKTLEALLTLLREEYDRLFSETGKEKISLVESVYRPWSQDPSCGLAFAKETGLLMGDSAVHLSRVYQGCGLEIAEPLKGMPDHLIVELEFLSYLYQWAEDKDVGTFIKHHFDWIPLLIERGRAAHPHPFYGSLLEFLGLFVEAERERLETENNGKKNVF
jgi:putative dimethyl sulfoxide reductase chaperone